MPSEPFDRLAPFLRPANTTTLTRTSSNDQLPQRLRTMHDRMGMPTRHAHLQPLHFAHEASGPMVPNTRYTPASFRPVIGVAEVRARESCCHLTLTHADRTAQPSSELC